MLCGETFRGACGRTAPSGGRGAPAVVTNERGGACPGAVDQQQAEQQGPGADGGQQKGHEAVGLQEEVAGVNLPGEQEQHEQVERQRPTAETRPLEVGPEGVATATVVQAPAQVRGEGHVEGEQLGGEDMISGYSSEFSKLI